MEEIQPEIYCVGEYILYDATIDVRKADNKLSIIGYEYWDNIANFSGGIRISEKDKWHKKLTKFLIKRRTLFNWKKRDFIDPNVQYFEVLQKNQKMRIITNNWQIKDRKWGQI
jgi:hypothetical protein